MNLYPALEPVKQWLLKNPPVLAASEGVTKNETYKPDNSYDETVAVLRLDYEAEWNNDIPSNWENVVLILIREINDGVTDLIENGDRESTDPLLKTLDGRKKHGGAEPTMAEFFDISVHQAEKPKKDSTEYTVWLKVRVRWL